MPVPLLHEEETEPGFVEPPPGELIAVSSLTNGLIFGTRLEREPARRRPLIVEVDSQLSLF